MSRMYLLRDASKARVGNAEHARRNRAEIVRELSWGRVSRRELLKLGLITGTGLLAPIGGLNPFVKSVYGQEATGVPLGPLFGVQPFTQPMPRFDLLRRSAISSLSPAPTAEANETQQAVDPKLGGGVGPIEGRPPGPVWAHQRFSQFPPAVAVQATQAPATSNLIYNPEVPSSLNSRIDPARPFRCGSIGTCRFSIRTPCGHSTARFLPSSCRRATANRSCFATTTACRRM
jgi:hypothetical protein